MRSTAFCMAACMQELCDVSLADAVEASVFHEATSRQPKLVSCMQGLQIPDAIAPACVFVLQLA